MFIIRRCLFVLLFSILSCEAVFCAEDWLELKSTHFIIHYRNATEGFISQLSSAAEQYYDGIAGELGFRRFDFWLWDKRANIYIYDNAALYQQATGQPAWAVGNAIPQNKSISAYVGANNFFEMVLPHEMSHIIFREFVGFNNTAVPLWLDEGVASYYQKTKYAGVGSFLLSAMESKRLMNIEELSSVNSTALMDKERAALFYSESFSIVDFLFRAYGRDRFVAFCQSLRDTRNLNRALALIYSFDGIQELDKAWQRSLKK